MSLVTATDAPPETHSRNKILVLGHDVQHVVDLLRRMLSLAANGSAAESTISPPTLSETEPAVVIPWTIETKYYTARVDFWIDTCPAGESHSEIMEAYDQIGGAIDAVMFVFDKGEPEKFDDLSRWLPFVERHEPSITLCVADPMRQTQTVDAETNHSSERYEIWCLENGFEYIDAEACPTDESQSFGDGTFVERVGLDRVLEALQTHMWEGLKRKCVDDQEKMDAVDTEEEEEKFMNELLNMKVHDLPDPDRSAGNDSLGIKTDDDDFTEFVGSENFDSFDEDDGFEKAYETLRDFRESSKDLPDSERKRLAAEVVLSFVKEFGD